MTDRRGRSGPLAGAARLTPPPAGVAAGREDGRARRDAVPRRSHARWTPAPDRPDPIDAIGATNEHRVPELVPLRWGRMLASPFTFYRGAPALMAWDLSRTPSTGIHVQACGDAHLMNFGLFGTPDRELVFDVNDFDETLPGPWEWDVKRLAASFVVAARSVGLGDEAGRAAALLCVRRYREAMAGLAERPALAVWHDAIRADDLVGLLKGDQRKAVQRVVDKSRANTSLRAFDKLTVEVDGVRRFVDTPPTMQRIVVDVGTERAIVERYVESMPTDSRVLLDQYRFVDAARKVVGVGSVGTRCSVALFQGVVHGDPLLLQVKQATASVLEPYVGPSEHAQAGQRVVTGQRVTQASSDLLLGWTDAFGVELYVRQLRDMKGAAQIESFAAPGLAQYGGLCGVTLARAHARTGVASLISGYLGTGDAFDRAIVELSGAYADQNERDHQRLVEAVASGEVTALAGV